MYKIEKLHSTDPKVYRPFIVGPFRLKCQRKFTVSLKPTYWRIYFSFNEMFYNHRLENERGDTIVYTSDTLHIKKLQRIFSQFVREHAHYVMEFIFNV